MSKEQLNTEYDEVAEYNFQIEAISKLKQWLRLQKSNQGIDPSPYLQDQGMPSFQWHRFKLKMSKIDVSYDLDDKQKKVYDSLKKVNLKVKCFCNIFLKTQNTFIGRTFESRSFQLKLTEDHSNIFTTVEEDLLFSLFVHTTLKESSEPHILIEMHVYEIGQRDVLESSRLIGTLEIPLLKNIKYTDQREKTTIGVIKKSNPRDNFLIFANNAKVSFSKAVYQFLPYSDLANISQLIPDSYLIGDTDEIPGIMMNRDQFTIPYYVDMNTPYQLAIEDQFKIYISKIIVKFPVFVDQAVINLVHNSLTDQVSNRSKIRIIQKKLVLSFHNTWKLTNSHGKSNIVKLTENEVKTSEFNRDKKVDMQILQRELPEECDGIFGHPLGMAVIQLEYDLDIIKDSGEKIIVSRPIAQSLLPIYSLLGSQDEVMFQDDMMIGQGKSVMGDNLIDITSYKGKLNVYIEGILNLQGAPNVDYQQQQRQQMHYQDQQSKVYHGQSAAELLIPQNQSNVTFADTLQVPNRGQKDGQAYHHNTLSTQYGDAPINPLMMDDDYKSHLTHYGMAKEIPQDYVLMKDKVKDLESQVSKLRNENMFQVQLQKNLQSELQQKEQILISKDEYVPYAKEMDPENKDKVVMPYEQGYKPEGKKISQGLISFKERGMYDKTDFDHRNLTKIDKLFLIKNGIKGILDDVQEDPIITSTLEKKNIKTEIEDKYGQNMISIQFVAIKPHIIRFKTPSGRAHLQVGGNSLKQANLSKLQVYSEVPDNYRIPNKFYFKFRFFNGEEIKSDIVCHQYCSGDQQDKEELEKAVQGNLPIDLQRYQYYINPRSGGSKELVLNVNFDPSDYKGPNMKEEFAKYLYRRKLDLEIWDAESQMQFGICQIPLKYLLRQGKGLKEWASEINIFESNPHLEYVKGGLQIALRNIGAPPQRIDFPIQDQTFQASEHLTKTKIRSIIPVQIPKEIYQQEEQRAHKNETMEKESRLKERIRRFKVKQIDQNQDNEEEKLKNEFKRDKKDEDQIETPTPGDPDRNKFKFVEQEIDKKKRYINAVDSYKEQKKTNLANQIAKNFISKKKTYNVFFGQMHLIQFEFINQSDDHQAYEITIDDPDQFLWDPNDQELQLVSNPEEWKYFVQQKGLQVPQNYDIIYKNTIYLEANESIVLLFKYKTTRIFDHALSGHPDPQAFLKDKDKKYRKQYISNRECHIKVSFSKGKLVKQYALEISPSNQIVDQTFRFIERENKHTQFVLPGLYKTVDTEPANKPFIFLTYSGALAEWKNENHILIQLSMPKAGKNLNFSLLAYRDKFLSELLANWVLDITAVDGLDITTNIGQTYRSKLIFNAEIPRLVALHSSHSNIVKFQRPFDKPFETKVNAYTQIPIVLKNKSLEKVSVLVNCVDIDNKELVYSWIVNITPQIPSISQEYQFKVQIGQSPLKEFKYFNRLHYTTYYSIETQDKDILTIQTPIISIAGEDMELINAEIIERDTPGHSNCFIFIQDREEKIFDVILFKVEYVKSLEMEE